MTATTSSVSPFNFGTHAVRVILKNNEPWFVAKDVCDTLGYTHVPHAMRILDDDEKGVHLTDTPGGDQKLTVINESGLYALVLRSRKPEARKFAKWVTSEVLPAIRKTGSYELPNLYRQLPGDKLNQAQAQQLRGLLDETVKHLPKEKQGAFMMQGWSKLKAHFGVPYRDIPVERFDEAVSLLTRHVVEYANPPKDTIRISPQALINNAADLAGQLFAEALKASAHISTSNECFMVTADFAAGKCRMERMDAISLADTAAIMGTLANRMTRHHAPMLAA